MELTICLLSFAVVAAQTPDPLSFFPHHAGDVWEYTGVEPPHHVWQERIESDSLGSDGRYYLVHSRYGIVRIDTLTYEVRSDIGGGNDFEVLYFKLNAVTGETWALQRFSESVLLGRVVAEYNGLFWGEIRAVKQIEVVDSASGLQFATEYLASGLGPIGRDIDTFPEGRLTGAIIDGHQYGDITLNIRDQVIADGLPFRLAQNYPNPFNGTTVIEFFLEFGADLDLRVFDMLGREVAILHKGHLDPGVHQQRFSAGALPSGAYLYVLRTPTWKSSRRMLILK